MIETRAMHLEELLPEAPADAMLAQMFGADVYAVGGRIRDAAIGYVHNRDVAPHKDLDYVITGHTLGRVHEILTSANIAVDTVGTAFSVLKVRIGTEVVDVSMARREISTGPGHRDFEVVSSPDVLIEEDLLRRDFTINALALNLLRRSIVAPDGALEDVRTRTIRAIGRNTFEDDPLRLLRAAQFASRLGFEIEAKTFRQMQEKAQLVRHCSAERVRDEIIKLMEKSNRPSIGFEILRDTGLLAHIVPELLGAVGLVQNRHHDFDVWDHVMAALDHSAEAGHDLVTRLAVLMHDIGKPATAAPRSDGEGNTFHGHHRVGAEMTQEIMRRLRFPEKTTEDVVRAVRHHMYDTREVGGGDLPDAALRRFIRRVGVENLQRQFQVRYADVLGHGPSNNDMTDNLIFQKRVQEIVDQNPVVSPRNLKIRGHDVIAIFIDEGLFPANYKGDKTVSVVIEKLMELVLEAPSLNEPELLADRCAQMVREMVAQEREIATSTLSM